MSGTFTIESDEDGRKVLAISVADMAVSATVPLWKDLLTLDFLVEAEEPDTQDHPLALTFSSQWMDLPVSAVRQHGNHPFDGLHVTWPENSENEPEQPPASVYDGRHGMVTQMDLRLDHKAEGFYRLKVGGATEFINRFEIEADVTFNKVHVANDDRTQDAAVAAWFDETFPDQDLSAAWQTLRTGDRELYFYVAQRGAQTAD